MSGNNELTPRLFWAAQGDGISTPVVAYESGVPGLLLQRPLGDPQNGTEFLVVHETGPMVLPYILESLEEARAAAHRIADLTDWTQPADAIRAALKNTEVAKAMTADDSIEVEVTAYTSMGAIS